MWQWREVLRYDGQFEWWPHVEPEVAVVGFFVAFIVGNIGICYYTRSQRPVADEDDEHEHEGTAEAEDESAAALASDPADAAAPDPATPQLLGYPLLDTPLDALHRGIAPKPGPTTIVGAHGRTCLLYTSPSPRDQRGSRMPSSA